MMTSSIHNVKETVDDLRDQLLAGEIELGRIAQRRMVAHLAQQGEVSSSLSLQPCHRL